MGRPRQYDPDAALDAVQRAFWARGYAATSVTDLCDATGMKKGSLYQAFGDKRALFFQVLDRYLAGGGEWIDRIAAAPDAAVLDAISAWLDGATRGACTQAGPGGCMAVNALIELGPHDAEVAERLEAHFTAIRVALAEALERGQRAGVVRQDRAAAAMARYLETLVGGLTTAGRAGDAAGALPIVELALDALRARPSGAAAP